ncbi:MAG: hypothetical protein KKF88_04410 [Alphaproteobacteria bacterium]|nr:hypothetical protein [Alphaproteobacteria bacterium]
MRPGSAAAALFALALAAPGLAWAQETPETRVEDIVVLGTPLREQVETFADTVVAPPHGRGPARWSARSGICVGVVNLQREAAQAMADRVSEVALDLGLPIGEPGCSPNVLIIATDDAPTLTAALVERSPNAFRPPYSGSSRSRLQLRRFIESDAPVRWWHVSLPVNSETGGIAVRIPGYAPPQTRAAASRLTTLIQNDLKRAYVIIDIDQVEGVSFRQLADYVAMVAFAQIDPDADLSGFPTILNVFDNPTIAFGLTDWDQSYLGSLYGAELNQSNPNAQSGAVAALMFRERRRIEDEAEAALADTPAE